MWLLTAYIGSLADVRCFLTSQFTSKFTRQEAPGVACEAPRSAVEHSRRHQEALFGLQEFVLLQPCYNLTTSKTGCTPFVHRHCYNVTTYFLVFCMSKGAKVPAF